MILFNRKSRIDDIKDYIHKHPCLLCILITTLLFIVLFYKYIFQGYVYMFTVSPDIGSDTANTYYPIMYNLSKLLHFESDWSNFNLNFGLGANMLSSYLTLLNPVDLLNFVFPTSMLTYGILFATFCKFQLLTVFSYSYFKTIFKSKKTICLCTLIWTFSSYTLVWGNHYQFLSCIVYFTAFMALFHKILIGEKKYVKFFIPLMAFFAYTTYYFFYITGIFSVIYIIAYGILNKFKFRQYASQFLHLAIQAFLAIGLSMVMLLPILYAFLCSSRVLSTGQSLTDLISFYDPHMIYAFMTRFLSPNLLGNAFYPPWYAVSNFYEIAELNTSLLIFPAFIYVLLYNKNKRKNRVIFVISLLALLTKITSQILIFNTSTQRWVFIILLLEVLCIGLLFDYVFLEKPNGVILKKVFTYGLLVSVVYCSIVYIINPKFNGIIDNDIFFFIILMIITYNTVSVLLMNHKNMLFTLIMILIVTELIGIYSPIYSNRGIQKKRDFYSSGYHDGTQDVVYNLMSQNDEVFRIDKTYISQSNNDSLIQQYPSFTSYSSINSEHMYNFYSKNNIHLYEGTGLSRHVMELSYKDPIFKAFLGEKYILSFTEINDVNYKLVKKANDIFIYENINYMGFGQVKYNHISSDVLKFKSASLNEKVLSDGYYTNSNSKITKAYKLYDILDLIVDSEHNNLTIKRKNNSLNIFGTDNDMYFIIKSKDIQNEIGSNDTVYLDILFYAETASSFQVFFDEGNGYSEENSQLVEYTKGNNHINITLPLKTVKAVRIDPSIRAQTIKLNKADIISLKDNDKTDSARVKTKYASDSLISRIDTKQNGMFILPIIFDEQWCVTVDGKEAKIIEVDNGLIGIPITSGKHEVRLQFKAFGLKQGAIISICFIFITILYLFWLKRS